MEIPFFSLERQLRLLEPELKAAGEAVFRSNNFIQGSFVEKFEYEFADFLKVADCVTCGNATDGLELVLRALEIGPEMRLLCRHSHGFRTLNRLD